MSEQDGSPTQALGDDRLDTPWLLRQRAAVPDPVRGYVDRPPLEKRCTALESRITLLQAPGGFGKTALLAHCCGQLQGQGVLVAWLSLDENDSPQALAGYLALAFEIAGIDTALSLTAHKDERLDPTLLRRADTRVGYRIALLIRTIERLDATCFLALDEVERLTNPDAVATLNLLVRAAPPNLHMAMSFREVPPGLDIANLLLDGAATVVTADDLRFSNSEVARFFDSELSRRNLAVVAAKSSGWPIALRIYRNAGLRDSAIDVVGGDAAAMWIESRLWRGLSVDDRDFVLDIALFDWLDPDLIDEATGTLNSRRRLESMDALAGLLETSGSESGMRLHPLIRDHCINRRFAEDPGRFREIHRSIAGALARRGQIVDALRHAAEAGDTSLTGKIAREAGGTRLWVRRGFSALLAVDQYLTADIVAADPRLALVRCLVLAITGDIEGANRAYAAIAEVSDTQADPDGADRQPWAVDRWYVYGMLSLISCAPVTNYFAFAEGVQALGSPQDMDQTVRGIVNTGRSFIGNAIARFDEALEWIDRARTDVGRNTRYLSPHLDYQAGLACMAMGRTQDAARWYSHGLADARKRGLGDSSVAMLGEVLAAELELERSAGPPALRPPPPSVLGECGAWLDVYAAATGVAADLAQHERGVDGALHVVDDVREYARRTNRFTLQRLICAQRVSLLVANERRDEAERSWRAGDLPVDDADCLDLDNLLWREVEAIATGRLDLLIARRNHERARALATSLLDLSAQRGMTRTLMRALATSVRLEASAGDTTRALEHLTRFVALYQTADYARPLARERHVALPLLERIGGRDDGIAVAVRRLRETILEADVERPEPDAPLALTPQERDILQRIERQSDAEIARRMHMTHDALRYRIRRLFAKLDARSRHDAVHKARAIGILPPADASK